jgi:hypothetical protein
LRGFEENPDKLDFYLNLAREMFKEYEKLKKVDPPYRGKAVFELTRNLLMTNLGYSEKKAVSTIKLCLMAFLYNREKFGHRVKEKDNVVIMAIKEAIVATKEKG